MEDPLRSVLESKNRTTRNILQVQHLILLWEIYLFLKDPQLFKLQEIKKVMEIYINQRNGHSLQAARPLSSYQLVPQ